MSSNYALKPCASNCQPGSDLLQIFFMEAIFWILRGARAKKKSEDTDWEPHAFHHPSLQARMYPFPTHVLLV